jgi:hypothetical protein
MVGTDDIVGQLLAETEDDPEDRKPSALLGSQESPGPYEHPDPGEGRSRQICEMLETEGVEGMSCQTSSSRKKSGPKIRA